MNVFIRIFDIQKELSGKEYDVLKKVTDFPQLLEKLIAKNPEKLMQDNFYVEFYSISDEGKFEKLYSTPKAPKYNPEADELFIVSSTLWGEYDYLLEEMKKEYSSQFKEIRKKRVFLFSTYGLLELIRTTQKRFIEVFGDAVAERVCPVMRCDVTVEEFARNIAKWVIQGIK